MNITKAPITSTVYNAESRFIPHMDNKIASNEQGSYDKSKGWAIQYVRMTDLMLLGLSLLYLMKIVLRIIVYFNSIFQFVCSIQTEKNYLFPFQIIIILVL